MMASFLRKVNSNLTAQVENFIPHLMNVVPAALFFLALLILLTWLLKKEFWKDVH